MLACSVIGREEDIVGPRCILMRTMTIDSGEAVGKQPLPSICDFGCGLDSYV